MPNAVELVTLRSPSASCTCCTCDREELHATDTHNTNTESFAYQLTQMCRLLSQEVRESCSSSCEAPRVSPSLSGHAIPNSEIYTSEYSSSLFLG